MLNNLLEIIANQDGNYYFDNRFGEACIYALIGFLIVFAGIVLIIFIIWLVGLLMRKTNNLAFLTNIGKKKNKKTQPKAVEDTLQTDEIPADVKVAIMAAIMCYYEEEAPKCEFKVKRIKRL